MKGKEVSKELNFSKHEIDDDVDPDALFEDLESSLEK